MKIVAAELVISAARPTQFPREPLPEIAFHGRSNVGKSSLVNSLLRQKGLAFISSTPGRTQSINFFRINRRFLFVDLPGYGYARASRALRQTWDELIESYLKGRRQLVVNVLIVDSRVGPTEQDLLRQQWLHSDSLPFFIVSTKADKLSKVELQKSIKHTQTLSMGAEVVAFSALDGTGHDKVWRMLQPYIETYSSLF